MGTALKGGESRELVAADGSGGGGGGGGGRRRGRVRSRLFHFHKLVLWSQVFF